MNVFPSQVACPTSDREERREQPLMPEEAPPPSDILPCSRDEDAPL
jgi:hypothetical protein